MSSPDVLPDNPFEFYPTPVPFTAWLGHEVPITGRIFEPCVGDGALMYAAAHWPRHPGAPRIWETNDLDPHWPADTTLDATEAACWEGREIDWTVTNPPFTGLFDILEHALRHSRVGVALHVRMSFLEPLKTGRRYGWLRDHPPAGLLFLPRVAFQRSITTGEWTTDSVATLWAVWQTGAAVTPFHVWPPDWLYEALKTGEAARRAAIDVAMDLRSPGYRSRVLGRSGAFPRGDE
jgi:hypothetical protein